MFDKARSVPVPAFISATTQWPEMFDKCAINAQQMFDKARSVPVPAFISATGQWPEMFDKCSINAQ